MVHIWPGRWGRMQPGKKAQYGFLFKEQKGKNGEVITRKMTAEEIQKYGTK